MTTSRALFALPVAAFVAIGCVLPLAVLLVFSVFRVEDLDLVPDLTLQSWRELFVNPTNGFLLGKSVLTGTLVAIVTGTLGYPLALAMAWLDRAWKGVALTILLTPLYTGELVRLYAWRLVLGSEGMLNSFLRWTGVVDAPVKALLFSPFATGIVLVYNTLPFMVLAIWISVELVDRRLIEAARDLGARPLQAFRWVVLPLTVPGLAAGAFAAFALAAGDLLTPNLMGGTSGASAMGMIDTLFGVAFDWPMASVLSLALLFLLVVAAAVIGSLMLRVRGARAALRGGVR